MQHLMRSPLHVTLCYCKPASKTFRYSAETVKHVAEILSFSASPIILVPPEVNFSLYLGTKGLNAGGYRNVKNGCAVGWRYKHYSSSRLRRRLFKASSTVDQWLPHSTMTATSTLIVSCYKLTRVFHVDTGRWSLQRIKISISNFNPLTPTVAIWVQL